jgi:hypothetical protein
MKKKCKVIMLPAKGESKIWYNEISKKIVLFSEPLSQNKEGKSFNPVNIHITSDDEIKEGDWCIMFDDLGNIFSNPQQYKPIEGHILNKGLRKIIATTDTSLTTPYMTGKRQQEINGVPQVKPLPKLSQELIQAYCNKPFNEIEVEYVYRGHFNMPSEHWDCILKTNQSNNIITSFIKDSYSREEVIGLVELLTYEMAQKIIGNRKSKYPYEHNIIPQDWIKENL